MTQPQTLKQQRHAIKVKMAAYHYLNTSKDGAVICRLCGITPFVLNGIGTDESGIWMASIRFWNPGFTGDGEIKGEFYRHTVSQQRIKTEFKRAARLWRLLISNPENTHLKRHLNLIDAFGREGKHE